MSQNRTIGVTLRLAIPVAFVLVFGNVAGSSQTNSLSHAAYACLAFLIAYWLGVFVHEFGHAFAGLARGMTLLQFTVGPVMLDWTQGALRLRWNGFRYSFAGSVRFSGDEPTTRGVSDHIWMTLGGPVAELLFGFALVISAGAVDGWLHTALMAGGSWSLLSCLINLLPFRKGFARSDGARLRTLMRGGADAMAYLAAGRWTDSLLSPEAPGNWPDDVVQSLESALARPHPLNLDQLDLALIAGTSLYFYYADRQEWVEANHVIAKASDLPRSAEKRARNSRFDLVDVLHAIHLALRGRNSLAARSDLQRVHPRSAITGNSYYIGARAAIALAEWDPVTAIELATKAKMLLAPSTQSVGTDRLEGSWWDEVIVAAKALLPLTASDPNPGLQAMLPAPLPISSANGVREGIFAWDPGVPSDLRTVWIWRSRTTADFDLSA